MNKIDKILNKYKDAPRRRYAWELSKEERHFFNRVVEYDFPCELIQKVYEEIFGRKLSYHHARQIKKSLTKNKETLKLEKGDKYGKEKTRHSIGNIRTAGRSSGRTAKAGR